jgi:hypothetical protein
MTDTTSNGSEAMTVALPFEISVPDAFPRRMLTQRQIDLLSNLEPGVTFAELTQTSPFRIIAWRWLLVNFPHDDPTRLWMHSYDVSVAVDPPDPTGTSITTPSPISSASGG